MEINDLRLIEIELFNYCNRKCVWCPNNFINRKDIYHLLNVKHLMPLLKELQQANYSGYISFSRYNEPMSQIDLFKSRLQLIKDMVPQATLVSNTNGDYLTRENLHGLLIDELTVMDYDNKGLAYCLGRLMGCGCTIDKITSKFIYAHLNTMKILYYIDWQKYAQINDRGGSLIQYSILKRNRECYEPQYFVGINYDGTVSPCCNIRNDIQEHKDYIMGWLEEKSLYEIINSKKYKEFVNMCAAAFYEEGSPCYYCQNNGGRYTRENGGIDYE